MCGFGPQLWGCSLVVKPQSSKLMMRVRFSSSPPLIVSAKTRSMATAHPAIHRNARGAPEELR